MGAGPPGQSAVLDSRGGCGAPEHAATLGAQCQLGA